MEHVAQPKSCSVNDDRMAVRKAEMTTYKIGYFVGSLSSTSINRVLSKALIRLAPEDLEFTEIRSGTCRCTAPTTTRTTHRRPPR